MTFQSQMPDEEIDPHAFVTSQFVWTVREYVGVKWKHRGRTKTGIDCVGLIHVAGKDCGLHEFADDVEYSRISVGQDLLKPFREHMTEVRLGPDNGLADLHDGDILILRDKVMPQHVGVMATRYGQKSLIHATVFYGKVVEQFIDRELERKAITAFRFKFLT
jgi:cell wall-associated NlpC family hydrolase